MFEKRVLKEEFDQGFQRLQTVPITPNLYGALKQKINALIAKCDQGDSDIPRLQGLLQNLRVIMLTELPTATTTATTQNATDLTGRRILTQEELQIPDSMILDSDGIPELNREVFKCLVIQFQGLGGEIRPTVKISHDATQKKWEVNGELADFPMEKTFYPVCHSGLNRSQILYHVLQDLGFNVECPHGACGGCDFWKIPTSITDDTLMYYNTFAYETLDKETALLANGRTRVPRSGEEELKLENRFNQLTIIDSEWRAQPQNLRKQQQCRDWMSQNYFAKIIQEGSMVVACHRGVHGMLDRLVEVAKQQSSPTNLQPLQGVILQPMDLDDPVTCGAPDACADLLRSIIKTA